MVTIAPIHRGAVREAAEPPIFRSTPVRPRYLGRVGAMNRRPRWTIGWRWRQTGTVQRLGACLVMLVVARAQDRPSSYPQVTPRPRTVHFESTPPTFSDIPYGPHFRQTIDVWQARSNWPTPLVFYVHGGGWAADDKSEIHQHLDVQAFLDAGISVAAANYRFLADANKAGVTPPVEWPLGDTRRALQFLRSKALEWNFDTTRDAATGVSAGGCASLWLALHDDMAEPHSPDPVARESTRLCCVAAKAPVTSLDPKQLREWIPNSIFSAHAFGFAEMTRADSFAPFLAARDSYLPQIRRFSPIEFASSDDPPVFMEFPTQDKPPVPGEPQTDPNHSAVSGLMLERKLQALGVKVELRYRGDARTGHANVQEFLIDLLRPGSRRMKKETGGRR